MDRRDRDRPTATPPPKTPAQPEGIQTPPGDEKLKSKRAKLEAWKKEREAKKALDEAKAKAMALAGKSVPGEFPSLCLSALHDFTPLDLTPL